MTSSLVGSEMCIRDSNNKQHHHEAPYHRLDIANITSITTNITKITLTAICLLYTSDAADDM
eukprot:7263719-Prorocentrum_lima.AAC.1